MGQSERIQIAGNAKRIVVKIGSGVLADAEGGLCEDTLKRLVEDICSLGKGQFHNRQFIVVSSGAVMAGRKALGLGPEKLSIAQKQAAAAIGQVKLMGLYEKHFVRMGRKVAQILLTHGDIDDRRKEQEGRYFNIRRTINTLLESNVIPVINENDSTAVDELKIGDNDTLAAKITSVVDVDLLFILSDVDGLYDSDPRKNPSAKKHDEVPKITDAIKAMAGDSSTNSGTGGMRAKVKAAEIASDWRAPTWIIGGKVEGSLKTALTLGQGGTFFHPHERRMSAKEHWLMHIQKPKGTIVVDEGAKIAIWKNGKSLLPSGIVSVNGDFYSGDGVSILDENKEPIASGTVNYGKRELSRIIGKQSFEIEEILGYKGSDEVIHADNMVRNENVSFREKMK